MPRVTIEILEGRSIEQKRAFAAAVADATVECFHVERRFSGIRFIEVRAEDYAAAGELICDISAREGRPVYGRQLEPRLTLQLVAGRSMEQKRRFVKLVSEAAANIFEVAIEDVYIYIVEMQKDELGFGGTLISDKN